MLPPPRRNGFDSKDGGRYERTADPSTTPLAIRLREASLRMTHLFFETDDLCSSSLELGYSALPTPLVL